MLANKILSATGGSEEKLFPEDVFAVHLYTGNGSTQTINNGIDLAGKGGLTWIKQRNSTGRNSLLDTARGANNILRTDGTEANALDSGLNWSFSSTGFALNDSNANFNASGSTYASWTFRKAPKFFDVVTWTGDGGVTRDITHGLGITPGLVIIKRTDTSGDWITFHRYMSNGSTIFLNKNVAVVGGNTSISVLLSTYFRVHNTAYGLNTLGGQYVAYVFAHDTDSDGVIQCGNYTGNGSANGPSVTLGWEPQFIMIKRFSGGIGDWLTIDSMRGMPVGSADAILAPNIVNAEASADFVSPTATGFQVTSTSSEVNTSGNTYIYLAIRRPNKPPTTGTQVYNAIARTGTGAAATVTGVGFAPDLVIGQARNTGAGASGILDRLRGARQLMYPSSASQEYPQVDTLTSFDQNGISVGADANCQGFNYNGISFINHFFRRAPGFFDVVCYTGIGVGQNVNHTLGVVPELLVIKTRSGTGNWQASTQFTPSNYLYGVMQASAALSVSTYNTSSWHESPPTESTFNTGRYYNTTNTTYVAYLFASLPGVSKVSSFTGNGTNQNIECGFSTGARFILIKRTDAAGDWYVWDSARGIVAANDPHLSLNTTAAEVTTDDSVDPFGAGFSVVQNSATNINVLNASYIFLAVS